MLLCISLLFSLGIIFKCSLKMFGCVEVMWNINAYILCQFTCFHDQDSKHFTAQLPVSVD